MFVTLYCLSTGSDAGQEPVLSGGIWIDYPITERPNFKISMDNPRNWVKDATKNLANPFGKAKILCSWNKSIPHDANRPEKIGLFCSKNGTTVLSKTMNPNDRAFRRKLDPALENDLGRDLRLADAGDEVVIGKYYYCFLGRYLPAPNPSYQFAVKWRFNEIDIFSGSTPTAP